MAILPILIHPDPRLKKTCEPVTAFDESLRGFCDDMLSTMYDAPGIGLAAPQVGDLRRIFVMDCTGKEEEPQPMVIINPEITWASEEENTHQEGCLSIPDQFDDVTRPAEIDLRFFDANGELHERRFDGLWATCAQHEIDHLNGTLFIDHISRMKRSMITRKMQKLKRDLARSPASTAQV